MFVLSLIFLAALAFLSVFGIRAYNDFKSKKERDLYREELKKFRESAEWYHNTYLDSSNKEVVERYNNFNEALTNEASPLDIFIKAFKSIDGNVEYSKQMNMEMEIFKDSEAVTGLIQNIKNEYESNTPTMTDEEFDMGYEIVENLLDRLNGNVFENNIDVPEAIYRQNIYYIPNQLRMANVI